MERARFLFPYHHHDLHAVDAARLEGNSCLTPKRRLWTIRSVRIQSVASRLRVLNLHLKTSATMAVLSLCLRAGLLGGLSLPLLPLKTTANPTSLPRKTRPISYGS